MSSLQRLRELLQPGVRVQTGEVVGLTTFGVQVRTHKGVQEFSAANPTQYGIGDTVRYQNGVLLGRQPYEAAVPEYYV